MMLAVSVEASYDPGDNEIVRVSLGPNVFLDTMEIDKAMI
jgi:hypothetical protein